MLLQQQISELSQKTIVLSLAIALSVVFVFHTALTWWSTESVQNDRRQAKTSSLEFNIDTIVSRNLFGTEQADAVEVNTAQQSATTNTEYVLQAVFESSVPEQSRAIISARGGQASSYTLGSEIAAGVTLEQIERDRVTLNINGSIEVLRFPLPSLASVETVVQRSLGIGVQDQKIDMGSDGNKLDTVRRRLEQLRNQSRTN